jgi:hypothetical protein
MHVWLDYSALVSLAFRFFVPHLEWQASVNLRCFTWEFLFLLFCDFAALVALVFLFPFR